MDTALAADLELSLRPRGDGTCAFDMRFREPDGAVDVRPAAGDLDPVRLDEAALLEVADDPERYGQLLTAALFADPQATKLYAQARAVAASKGTPLRVRLSFEPGPGLPADLRWETLRDPEGGRPLALAEDVLLSRYLAGDDWRPVRPRPRAALRALVVIANPSDLADYAPGGRPLSPVDVPGELARARAALGEIAVTPSSGQARCCSACSGAMCAVAVQLRRRRPPLRRAQSPPRARPPPTTSAWPAMSAASTTAGLSATTARSLSTARSLATSVYSQASSRPA